MNAGIRTRVCPSTRSILRLGMIGCLAAPLLAGGQTPAIQRPEPNSVPAKLVLTVRTATQQLFDLNAATGAGCKPFPGCITGPDKLHVWAWRGMATPTGFRGLEHARDMRKAIDRALSRAISMEVPSVNGPTDTTASVDSAVDSPACNLTSGLADGKPFFLTRSHEATVLRHSAAIAV